MANELIFDAWTPMSFKRALGSKRQPGTSWLAPTWVGATHERRLLAYKVLQAYIDNASRFFLTDVSQDSIDDHREYGDASLIVNQTLSSLLGDDYEIVTEGADAYNPDAEGDDVDPDAKAAFEFQEWIRDWADRERFPLKLLECERNAIGLGDGLYTLGWSAERKRPRLRTYDPGFYFPVLDDDSDDDEFPDRINVAWELEDDDRPGVVRVRRIRWELVPIPDGGSRTYEWNDEPSDYTVLMTDATWEIDLGKKRGVDDFSEGRAVYATYEGADGVEKEWKDVDLLQDFIPAVHIPNTVALANHYGRAVIATILQILDDLANADTDLQASSATTGKPPIVLSGARMGADGAGSYEPGDVWEVGENGALTMLDTSKALVALSAYVQGLLQRLSVNSRLPESLLGRVKPSDVPSGLALRLSFGPLETMIKEMRQVRKEKYRLLFKFVHRMALAAQAPDVPPEWIETDLQFGSYLPSDQASAVEMVNKLLTSEPPAISIETAVRILQQAGLPIEDVNEEVVAIQEQDFKGANSLLDALGDEQAVADYLGRDLAPEPAAPPAPTLDLGLPPTTQPPPTPDDVPLPGERTGTQET